MYMSHLGGVHARTTCGMPCGRGSLTSAGQKSIMAGLFAKVGRQHVALSVSCACVWPYPAAQPLQQHNAAPAAAAVGLPMIAWQQQLIPSIGLGFTTKAACSKSSSKRRRQGNTHKSTGAHAAGTTPDPKAAAGAAAAATSLGIVDQQEEQQQEEQQQQQQQQPSAPPGTAGNAAGSTDFMQPVTRPMYSPLHYNIQEFVQQVVPTAAERAEKQRIIQCVAVATRRAFETHQHVKVQPFGSLVNGLSTWNSDVDLVVTGLVKPSRITGGFSQKDKRVVYRALDKIAHQLRRNKKVSIRNMIIIRTARIPIIKMETSTRVVADISLGDISGPKAANYIAQQASAYPPLTPLVLVLKVYLRSCGLGEVMNGGLSSFSLTNMALAHLMEELKDGNDIFDLGEALYGFLLRFGDDFDTRRDAVSVALGGVVPRSDLAHLSVDAGLASERLLLEDPLTGRDVASGSYRIQAVQVALSKAARRLESLARSSSSSSSSSRPVNYLEGLFDVTTALDRKAHAADNRRSPFGHRGYVTSSRDDYTVVAQADRYMDAANIDQAADFEVQLEGRGSPGVSPSGSMDYSYGADDDDGYGDELEALLYPEEKPSRASRSRKKGGSR